MLNETAALLLFQSILQLTHNSGGSKLVQNVTFLEDQVPDPFFKNESLVCYGMYGCFSTISPWIDTNRPVCNLPDPPAKVNPDFCLRTRYNPVECQYLNLTNTSTIYRSHFVPYHKTYVITHGFLENGGKPWLKNYPTEFLKRGDVNVIVVGWGGGSAPPYTQAVANTRIVGRMVAMLIYSLILLTGSNGSDFHLIGHSLGSHISGYAGYTLQHHFNITLGRITGMDPAEPHFAKTQAIVRLDISDARFVDIIHTNAKSFVAGGLGINDPIGHLDFFPNSGDQQPGCSDGVSKFIRNESLFDGVRKFLSCDHVRSHEFMLESIGSKNCSFLAVECDSWESFLAAKCFPCKSSQHPNGSFCSNMGFPSLYDWNKSSYLKRSIWQPVNMYTITNNEKPYCVVLYKVSLNISDTLESFNHKGEIGYFRISINGTLGITKSMPIFKEQYFAPGSSHSYIVGGTDVGKMTHAYLFWEHRTTMNVMTWRIDPIIYIGNVTIQTFTNDIIYKFCPRSNDTLSSGSTMKMIAC